MSRDAAFHRKLARIGSVRRAVRSVRDDIKAKAEALFAPHDRPGGHEITKSDGAVDAYVSLVGPAPASVEFGHFTPIGEDEDAEPTYVEGLHIMGRAARS